MIKWTSRTHYLPQHQGSQHCKIWKLAEKDDSSYMMKI